MSVFWDTVYCYYLRFTHSFISLIYGCVLQIKLNYRYYSHLPVVLYSALHDEQTAWVQRNLDILCLLPYLFTELQVLAFIMTSDMTNDTTATCQSFCMAPSMMSKLPESRGTLTYSVYTRFSRSVSLWQQQSTALIQVNTTGELQVMPSVIPQVVNWTERNIWSMCTWRRELNRVSTNPD